jgi:thiol:disulfide interchange protein
VFLTVVAGQVTQTNVLSGLVTFVTYGIGMALVLVALTVALALGKSSIVARFRGAMKRVNTISGVILIIAGAYIVWFWGTTLGSGASSLDSVGVRFVENLSQWALNFVNDNTMSVAVALVVVVAAASVAVIAGHRNGVHVDLGERADQKTPR